MSKFSFITTILLLVVLVVASDYGEAATPITITTTGPAKYSIVATDLPDAAGMDLSISYAKDFLKEPVVTSGALLPAGAVMFPNTATPGQIRIGIITGGSIKGTGALVTISFTKTADPAPQPILATPSVYSASGSQLAVQAVAETTKTSSDDKHDDETTRNSTTAEAAPTTYISNTPQSTTTIGSVTLPQEAVAKNDLLHQGSGSEERSDESQYQNESATPGGRSPAQREVAGTVAVPEAKSAVAHSALKSSQGVLDRFRTNTGKRTLKLLVKLFDESALHEAGIVQVPAIAVADGKSPVTVSIDLAKVTDTPSFSLRGANLKGIRRLANNKWELAAMPQKGKTDVRLSILLKGESAEIPLVAVPPLIQSGIPLVALSEAALDGVLAKPLKNNKPAYDLNSDAKQDYLDDYILIAHWLLKQQHKASEAGQKKKPTAVRK